MKDKLGEDSEYYEDMDKILKAGTRAKEIVDQILPFSSRETDSSGYQLISMDAVLRDALKMVRMIIPPNIRMEADIDNLHANVFGSATQLHQVLLNLCSNAYQSMEDSSGVLTVSAVSLAEMIQPTGNAAEWVCVSRSRTPAAVSRRMT